MGEDSRTDGQAEACTSDRWYRTALGSPDIALRQSLCGSGKSRAGLTGAAITAATSAAGWSCRSRQTADNAIAAAASSWLGPVSAVARTGSGAMPQIGQEPGPTCRLRGRIGQVWIVPEGTGSGASMVPLESRSLRLLGKPSS
jgi:hypothetical protein